jgi:hypothetical protein
VNQCGRLERVVGPLAAKMPGGEGAKFIIDERHQLGRRRSAVAILQGDKKFCDLAACHVS